MESNCSMGYAEQHTFPKSDGESCKSHISRNCLRLPLADLPVDLPLDVGDVEEHLLAGEVSGHRQRGHLQVVLDVDGGAALNRQVEHALFT